MSDMTLEDPQKQLKLVVQKREQADAMAPRILREMQSSILFQCKWEELLMSAPISISCLGACHVAAISPKANVIFTPPKEGGFKYLQEAGGEYGLKMNLVYCSDLGRFAFIVAEDGMSRINMVAENVYNTTDDIIGTLGSPQDAKIMLRRQLESLRDAASDSFEATKNMDIKFEEWLHHACELHMACIATQTTANDKLVANEIDTAATQVSIDYQKKAVDMAQDATTKLEHQMNVATDAYKDASDEFPTGWDLLGQQVVGALADTLNTALNAVIPALVDNMNPIAKVKVAAGLASGLIHGDKQQPQANGTAAGGVQNVPTTNSAPPTSPAVTRIQDADDPAYAQVARDLPFFELISGIFIGESDGVDWDKAQGEPTKQNQSIAFAAKMLQSSQSSYASLATSAEPSKTYTQALGIGREVATKIVEELKKAKDVAYTLPTKDDVSVQKWQSDFSLAYGKIVGLNSAAKSFPGNPAGGAGVRSAVDPAVQTAQINAKTAQSQMLLDSAKSRLTTTQAALIATQDTYQKSTELLVKQQSRFAELQGNLDRLKSTTMTLSEIKAVLVQCIMLIVNLKAQVTNLVRFFKAIATTVDFVLKKQVNPFVDTMNMIVSNGADPNAAFKIGPYTLTDLQRSSVFNSTLTIRAYFSVFGDIAQMWMELSQEQIFPGIHKLDELSAIDGETDKHRIQTEASKLSKWSKEAADSVSKRAKEKQDKVLKGMETRIADIAATTKMLPPPPAVVQKAIKSGTEESKQAAQSGIEAQAEDSLVTKFAGTRLPRGTE